MAELGDERSDPDRPDREIVRDLAALGDAGVKALIDGLEAEGGIILWIRAAYALDEMGAQARPAVPVLIRGMQLDCARRPYAMVALMAIGPGAEDAVPALIPILEGEDASLRRLAPQVLRSIGPGAREAVPALVQALKHVDARTRWQSAVALECIDVATAAREARSMLVEAATYAHDPDLRWEAREALRRVQAWEKLRARAASQPGAAEQKAG